MKKVKRWVSQDIPRLENGRLLTGSGRFIADMTPVSNMHYAAILRSPYGHALIKSIDTKEARNFPGVVDVLTGEDVKDMSDPFPVLSDKGKEYYSMAIDKVRFVGEPVAVVVARDRYTAEDVLDLIEVNYEPLPVVTCPEKAMEPDAPLLHEKSGTNVALHRLLSYGDVDSAFDGADVTVKERIVYPKISPTPMETNGVICSFDFHTKLLTCWCGFHGPYSLHAVMTKALRLPSNKVRVIVPADVGGSFGVKIPSYSYILPIALACRKAGVPVKWIEDRRENLMASSSGVDRVAYVEMAATKEGIFTGLRMKIMDNVGGYMRAPEPGCLLRPLGNLTSAYGIKNVSMDGYVVVTNKSLTGPTRGYACQHLYFGIEKCVERIAEKLSLDPAELRRKNLILPHQLPYTTPTGGIYDAGDYPKAFDLLLELSEYDAFRKEQKRARKEGRFIGIGIAVGIDPSTSNMGYIQAALPAEKRSPARQLSGCAQATTIFIDHGGNVNVELSTVSHGQGHETVIAQTVADELGISPYDITVIGGMDTSTRAWTIPSGAYSSRFASVGPASAAMAARKLLDKMLKIAAHLFGVSAEEVTTEEGQFYVRDNPEKRIGIRRIASVAHWDPHSLPEGMEPGLTATYYFNIPVAKPIDGEDRVDSSATYGFTSDMAIVEVDGETGEVKIQKYISVHDAGTILHPGIAEGQVRGSIMHGVGSALYEELKYDEHGQFLTASFADYLVPTAMEAPEIKTGHIETPSPLTILGSKGIGEASSQTAPIAIVNAVEDALAPLDIKINTMPLSSDYIWRLMEEKKKEK